MMASEADTLKQARQILTRLRLDTAVLHLRIEHRILYVSGRFAYPFMTDGQADVNYDLLHEVDRQLHLIGDVKGVEYELKNWMHNADGGWSKRRIRD